MRVTKYFQSCLLVEDEGSKILIDPSKEETGLVDQFGQLAAVLFTHEHGDHFDPQLAEKFMKQDVPIYTNASTASKMQSKPNIVEDNQQFSLGSFEIQARELDHCLMPDGSQGPQNTGYLINSLLFHPGDGVDIDNLRVENLALPVIGPDVSPKDAFEFARKTGAKQVIPVHYDIFGAKPEIYAMFAKNYKQPFAVNVLGLGQSVEI